MVPLYECRRSKSLDICVLLIDGRDDGVEPLESGIYIASMLAMHAAGVYRLCAWCYVLRWYVGSYSVVLSSEQGKDDVSTTLSNADMLKDFRVLTNLKLN